MATPGLRYPFKNITPGIDRKIKIVSEIRYFKILYELGYFEYKQESALKKVYYQFGIIVWIFLLECCLFIKYAVTLQSNYHKHEHFWYQ